MLYPARRQQVEFTARLQSCSGAVGISRPPDPGSQATEIQPGAATAWRSPVAAELRLSVTTAEEPICLRPRALQEPHSVC